MDGYTILARFTTACLFIRCQEEMAGLRRKLERYKTREWASAGDEVLLEEIKTYKVSFIARLHHHHHHHHLHHYHHPPHPPSLFLFYSSFFLTLFLRLS